MVSFSSIRRITTSVLGCHVFLLSFNSDNDNKKLVKPSMFTYNNEICRILVHQTIHDDKQRNKESIHQSWDVHIK